MSLKLLMPVLLILALVPAAGHAQIVVIGYAKAAAEVVTVDSAQFMYGAEETWIATAGWHCEPTRTDTFQFPSFAGFPTTIRLAGDIAGKQFVQKFSDPAHLVWYPFDPPYETTTAMFDDMSGIEERPQVPARLFLAVSPSVVRGAAVIRTSGTGCLAILDAAGRTVRSLRATSAVRWAADDDNGRVLPEGIYFCRLTASQSAVVRKLVISH